MFQRFTPEAREAVLRARREAESAKRPLAGTDHLLLGLLADESTIPSTVLADAGLDRERIQADVERLTARAHLGAEDAAALQAIGIDLEAVRARVEEAFGAGVLRPPEGRSRRGRRHDGTFTPRAKKVLELALREAIRLDHRWIGPEHILLGILREGEGLAAKVLADAGVSFDELRRRTIEATGTAA